MRRCGLVGIIGAPNAGKSTLLNRLAGRKRAGVTHKANTTRAPIRATLQSGETQLLLVDTPGMHPDSQPGQATAAQPLAAAIKQANLFLFLVDAPRCHNALARAARRRNGEKAPPPPPEAPLLSEAKRLLARGASNAVMSLVLNKIDLLPHPHLLPLLAFWNEHFAFERSFLVSAKTGDGVGDIAAWLAKQAPAGEWLHPDTTAEEEAQARALACEIVREKLLLRLHQEIPHLARVSLERWERRESGALHMEQHISVPHERHRKIVLGREGQVIRAVSEASRREMERLFACPTHLTLRVKITP